MYRKTVLLLMTCLIALTSNAGTVTAVNNDWPPYLITETLDGPEPGLAVEIARQAYATQGYTLEVKVTPWSRVLHETRNTTADVSLCTWYSDERSEYLYFSQPYYVNPLHFFSRSDDPFEFEGLESLKGKSVGVIREFAYNEAFETSPDFTREPVNSIISNIHKLLAGRVDLIVGDPLVIYYTANRAGIDLEAIRTSPNPLRENNLYIAISKTHPNAKVLIEAFNKGLQEIKRKGIYDQILERYYSKYRISLPQGTKSPEQKKPQ